MSENLQKINFDLTTKTQKVFFSLISKCPGLGENSGR